MDAFINPSAFFFLCRAVGEIHFVQCDLRDVKQVEELCRRADQIFPAGIDILVNNAGNIIEELCSLDCKCCTRKRLNLTSCLQVVS